MSRLLPLLVPMLLLIHGSVDAAGAEHPAAEEREEELGDTLIPFPFYFYSPETKSGGGLSLSYVVRDETDTIEDRPDNYGAVVLFTQRSQYTVGLSADRYFGGERWHASLGLGFAEFPTTYYGIGNDTDADVSEDFTPRTFSLMLGIERRVRGRWRTGPQVAFADQTIVEREADAELVTPEVTGGDGGRLVSLGWAAIYDGRDRVFYPRSGAWARVDWSLTDGVLGADFDYFQQRWDLRWYRALGEETWASPVLALRSLVIHSSGTPPFQQLASLGGQELLRGYYEGRFRERNLWALQGEVRAGHWKRMGVVAFAAAGDVGHRFADLRLDEVRASYGLGLRWQLSASEGIQIRADLGFNDEGGSGFYLAFLEAF